LDADRTAKPLTRIVKHVPAGQCAGPGTHLDSLEHESETGKRTPLTQPEPKVRLTLGQALDEAIQRHEKVYPGSKVYAALIRDIVAHDEDLEVEVWADHFSRALTYHIPKER
jgi:hypothetical protein